MLTARRIVPLAPIATSTLLLIGAACGSVATGTDEVTAASAVIAPTGLAPGAPVVLRQVPQLSDHQLLPTDNNLLYIDVTAPTRLTYVDVGPPTGLIPPAPAPAPLPSAPPPPAEPAPPAEEPAVDNPAPTVDPNAPPACREVAVPAPKVCAPDKLFVGLGGRACLDAGYQLDRVTVDGVCDAGHTTATARCCPESLLPPGARPQLCEARTARVDDQCLPLQSYLAHARVQCARTGRALAGSLRYTPCGDGGVQQLWYGCCGNAY